jgi:predicted metal-dependent peptidase
MKVSINDIRKVLVQLKNEGNSGGGGGTTGGSPSPPQPFKSISVSSKTKLTADQIDGMVNKMVQKAISNSGSNMSEKMKKALNLVKEKGEIDWRDKFRNFLSEIGKKERYVLPNRRFVAQGTYLYTTKKYKGGLGNAFIVIDTSGSMFVNDEILDTVIKEAFHLFNEVNPERIYLMFCDTTVAEPVEIIERDDDFNIKHADGSGGTSFVKPFEWIDENILDKGEKIGPVIYFTDGDPTATPGWPDINNGRISEYADKVFWVITWLPYQNPNDKDIPFGEHATLKINPKIK